MQLPDNSYSIKIDNNNVISKVTKSGVADAGGFCTLLQNSNYDIFVVGHQVDGWSIYILLPSHTYTTNEHPVLIAVVTNATCTHILSIT